MSFVHATLVGHFDPASLLPGRQWQTVRPLDMAALEKLLSECSPAVRDQVEIRDGFIVVHWSAVRGRELMQEAHEFAYRLAEEQHIGWDGKTDVGHFDLIRGIYADYPEYRANLEKLADPTFLAAGDRMIREEFQTMLSPERQELIMQCLRLRHQAYRDAIFSPSGSQGESPWD